MMSLMVVVSASAPQTQKQTLAHGRRRTQYLTALVIAAAAFFVCDADQPLHDSMDGDDNGDADDDRDAQADEVLRHPAPQREQRKIRVC